MRFKKSRIVTTHGIMEMIEEMFKTIGFYSLILGIINVILFFIVIFGNRSIYFLILDLAIIGGIISLVGLYFDKNKLYALFSLFLILAPILIHWFKQKP